MQTFSECILSGVLAAWRRIPNYHAQEENNSLSGYKELWIFWCGDDPDFPRLLKSNLQGIYYCNFIMRLFCDCVETTSKIFLIIIKTCALKRLLFDKLCDAQISHLFSENVCGIVRKNWFLI